MVEYWHSYKNGHLSWEGMQLRMALLCRHVEGLLEEIGAADIVRMSGSCRNLLAHRYAPWTFIQQLNVELTDNHAERELRAFVLWRRRSLYNASNSAASGRHPTLRIATTLPRNNVARTQRKASPSMAW